jgi:hypothetical protein
MRTLYSTQNNVWVETNQAVDFSFLPNDVIIDVVSSNFYTEGELAIGVREINSSLERSIELKESEGGNGVSSYGISVHTNETGWMEFKAQGTGITFRAVYYYTGYFIIDVAPPVVPPTVYLPLLFFGAGFNSTNSSVGFINIRWTHNGSNVDDFEIQVSTDGVNFTHLAYTTYNNYTHLNVSDGLYRYYRVRATLFNVSWINSSWTPIDLERVYYVSGGVTSMPTDINWIAGFIWLGLLTLGVYNGSGVLKIFAGLFGMIFGLLLMTVNIMLSVGLIFISLYFIYKGADA